MKMFNKVSQEVPFKFGNKLGMPFMTFGGKFIGIKKNLNNLQNNHMEDKPKQSDLEKHTQRLQNTHHFN
jgi:hypothetical protein